MQRLPKGVIVMLALSVLGIGVIAAINYLVPPSPEERLQALRTRLRACRAAADSCRSALEREQERLFSSDARLDSLRRRIEEYESLHPRGVPTDLYDAYMETFNAYNRGIPDQIAAGDTLQAHWEACRGIVLQHNRLADSARALLAETGAAEHEFGPGTEP